MTEVPLMVMPWHRPDPCKPLKMQTDAAFKSSYLDYLATLRLDSPPLDLPLSVIAGTIGPSSNNVEVLVELMREGMTIALVPLALGIRKEHLDTIANIRTANTLFTNMRDMVYPLAIAVQTKGPGLRLGGLVKVIAKYLSEFFQWMGGRNKVRVWQILLRVSDVYDLPVTLPLHHKLTLTTDKMWRTKGTECFLYMNFPEMCHVITKGDIILVGNGIVILEVESVDNTECNVTVVGGGIIQSFMPVSVPDVPLNLPPLTEEDIDDLIMAAEMGVDIVVVSHTQTKDLIQDVRKILDEQDGGSGIKIWAQIESSMALQNLECILEVADAIVLSRISLLQDIPVEKLFLAQKMALSACTKAGVPVYVSSHFLPSMQVANTPSIAEVSDVTAAILDGVDGFLMRNTISHGKHPEVAIRTLIKICVEAEAAVWHHQTFSYLSAHAAVPLDPTHSIAIAAVEAALKANAAVILLATTSGRSAQLLARYRPRCPIIAVTRYGQVARQLNSWRAVIPVHYVDHPLPEWTKEVDVRFQYGIEFAKHKNIVRPGDVMVLLNGWRQGAGFTNTIRIVYASDSFPWVYPHKVPEAIPTDDDVREDELEEERRTTTAAGEPTATITRVTTKSDASVKSPSLTSRVMSMEEDYKSIASLRSKEMEAKLNESIKSMKTESKLQARLNTVTSVNNQKTMSKITSVRSEDGRKHTGQKTETVLSTKHATVSSTKHASVLSHKPATVSSNKHSTILSTKPATVLLTDPPNEGENPETGVQAIQDGTQEDNE